MRYWLILVFASHSIFISAQAVISVDKTRIRIGDQVHATVEILSGMNGEWINKDHIWPDSMKGIDVVSGPEMINAGKNPMEATWTLSFFDTGYVQIPAVPLYLSHGGRTDTLLTQEIPIQVLSVEPDSSGLLAIRDIRLQPFSIAFYKRYIPHALALIALIFGAYFLWKRFRKPVVVESPPPVVVPAHTWALDALQKLETERLWQKGEIKEHYSQLTAIFRGYLERRYGIHALEQTSDEILSQLSKINLSTSWRDNIRELLSMADLIKFAKADPGVDLHAETISRVKSFVVETSRSYAAETEPGEIKTEGDEVVE